MVQQATLVVQARAASGSSAAAPEATPAKPARHRAETRELASACSSCRLAERLIVIGTPSGTDGRNVERRMILRDLWFTEYDNISKTVGAEFL